VDNVQLVREITMMIRQLREGTESEVERQGMCLSGIGGHNDFKTLVEMHLWLSGACSMMNWYVYQADVKEKAK
jgi:hypothetical protein